MFSWKSTVLRSLILVGISLAVGLVHNYAFSQQGIRLGQSPLQAVSGLAEALFIDLTAAHDKWKAGAIFVDAREEVFYLYEGHIEKSVSLPNKDFEAAFARSGELLSPKDRELVIYCSGFGCEDSAELAKMLMDKGYSYVFVYEGGWPEWSDAGLPIVSPAGEVE